MNNKLISLPTPSVESVIRTYRFHGRSPKDIYILSLGDYWEDGKTAFLTSTEVQEAAHHCDCLSDSVDTDLDGETTDDVLLAAAFNYGDVMLRRQVKDIWYEAAYHPASFYNRSLQLYEEITGEKLFA